VIVPTPEITIISGASSIAFNWRNNAMPSMSGNTRSIRTTSGRQDRKISTAREPTAAARTSYPGEVAPCSTTIFNQSVTMDSSSTTSTRRRFADFIEDISAGQPYGSVAY
jgi:hypothetical protein